jgi:hypothetical protein
MMNLGMQVYNIKTFLLQHNPTLDLEQVDIAAYIDPTLSLTENKKLFAQKFGIPINQMGGRVKAIAGRDYNKAAKKEVSELECDFFSKNCEQNCNNNSCKAFRKHCPGEVQPCEPGRYTKTARRKTATTYGDCDVVSYIVRAHERPPQHNCRNCQPVMVREYTVNTHKRLCRRPGYG